MAGPGLPIHPSMELGLRRVRAHAIAGLLAASAALLGGSAAFARLPFAVAIALGLACALTWACAIVTWRVGERFDEGTLASMVIVATGLLTLAAAVSLTGSADLVVLFLLPAIFGACFLAPKLSIMALALSCGGYAWVDMRIHVGSAPTHWATATLVLASAAGVVGLLRRQLENAHAELARLATRDPLTSLLNRRGFDQRVAHEIERHRRSQDPFSILLCDLDHFKMINDQYGHAVGDRVLIRSAARLQSGVRAIDAAARVGGEEIAILLVHCDCVEACEVAERLRASIAEPEAGEPDITVSIGVAESLPDELPAQLYTRADRALYAAKGAGRDCVRAAAAGDEQAPGGSASLGLVA
jgi:diguanylate cyclase (GGDEF)-like protein